MKNGLARVAIAAEKVAELQKISSEIDAEIAAARRRGAQEESDILEEMAERESEAQSRLADVTVMQAEERLRAAERAVAEAEAAKAALLAGATKDAERVESLKAALLAAVAGAAASLPYILPQSGTGAEAVVDVLSTGASCFLFGVVWRYAVRGDIANTQLKSGVVAAFGLVRGVGLVRDGAVAALGGDAVAAAASGVQVAESLVGFFFASVALEWAAANGLLRLYGDAGSLLDDAQ